MRTPTRPRRRRSRTRSAVGAVALSVSMLLSGCSGHAPSDQPAVDVLMRSYDPSSGVWPATGWWNSANALRALAEYMVVTGDQRYLWVLGNTYAKKRNALRGNFINELIDDTGWWALTWIRAYDITGNRQYLATAQRGVDFMWRYRDDVCGGGLWWTTDRTYKNAIANELFIQAAAQLHNRIEGDTRYLNQALQVWNWFERSGMINADNMVNDGLKNCRNNGGTTWTYNQGVILGALVALNRATGDDQYLVRARELADASTSNEAIQSDGILTEPCEATGCDIDGPSFKGIYVRNLGELNAALTDRPYSDYLTKQATTAYDKNRRPDGTYGLHWAGPVQFPTVAAQQSAVDLIVAAQPPPQLPPATTTTPPTSGPQVSGFPAGSDQAVPIAPTEPGQPAVPTGSAAPTAPDG